MLDVADRIDYDATEKPKKILLNYIFTGANFVTLNLMGFFCEDFISLSKIWHIIN